MSLSSRRSFDKPSIKLHLVFHEVDRLRVKIATSLRYSQRADLSLEFRQDVFQVLFGGKGRQPSNSLHARPGFLAYERDAFPKGEEVCFSVVHFSILD